MLFIKNGIEIAKKYSNNPDENDNVDSSSDDNTDFGFNLDSDFEWLCMMEKCYIVGISGSHGSGKSTLIQDLSKKLLEEKM